MAKIIYKALGLLVIFVASLWFFGQGLETNHEVAESAQVMEDESFPVLTIETQGKTINPLYGYAATMEPSVVRETMTPLDESKTITLHINKSKNYLTEITYRIIDKESNEVYDTQSVKGFTSDQKEVRLVLSYALATSTEYILDIGGVMSDGREVHYYTRLKYYIDNSGFDAKMAFAKKFHEDTFQKSKMESIAKYLETNVKKSNSTLAKVSITSSSDLVTWAGMSPKVISDEYVSVLEYNMETACIQYNYFVKANTNSGEETYHVKEFYRVRHAFNQDYLLNFERTMEADFDPSLANQTLSQIKIGITSKTTGNLIPKNDGKGVFFSRNGVVYFYDMVNNSITPIYSIFSEEASYLQRAYDENDIRLIAVDDEESLYFSVYGYQPRGAYEGDVGIILYKYSQAEGIEELVNLPMSTTFRQLNVDFDPYGYVSPRDVYYFTVANTVYAYNISGQRLEILQENVKDISFQTMESSNCYVWSSSLAEGYGDNITIYHLENDEHQLISKPDEESYIRLLGTIENNVVYGFVNKNDIKKQSDGTKIVPCYELLIADTNGKVVKTYEKEGCYIQSADGKGNVVSIKLCKKVNGGYKDAGEDSILNRSDLKASKFAYTSRSTTKSLLEWYIKFPSTFTMRGEIKEQESDEKIRTGNRSVRLESSGIEKYYISALGRFTKAFENVKDAIHEADKQMGVVISGDHQVVWERSGAFNQNNLGDLTLVKSSNSVSNLAACAAMVLNQASDQDISASELSKSKDNLYDMLAMHISKPLNLKECTLEQVIYFVSNNKPVIAMTSDSKAVVIGGYTMKNLTIYDPDHGKKKVNRRIYEEIFKSKGNRFLSYMEDYKKAGE
ncbi:MAG: hypothetical protein K5639_07825 [Eubacterium sp.]|nr:hypothetical protein [Eubacterium sp.]